jgi:predicted RNase H-like nuclease (RuvC/YqgF family)
MTKQPPEKYCDSHSELVGDMKILKYSLGIKDKENGERKKQIEELKQRADQLKEESTRDYKTLAEKIDSIYTEIKVQKGIREQLETEYETMAQKRDRTLKYAFFIIASASLFVTLANIKGWI